MTRRPPAAERAADGPPCVAVVDIGISNRYSVEKALRAVGAEVVRADTPAALTDADGVVLPGVGTFSQAMERLQQSGMIEPLEAFRDSGRPVLGICLGEQLLFDSSTERGRVAGEPTEGLGWIPGDVTRLELPRLPNVGWAPVEFVQSSPLAEGLPEHSCFYHMHSFAARPADPRHVLGETGSLFVSAVQDGNVFGVQFHPEKSGPDGLRLLRNFAVHCARPR